MDFLTLPQLWLLLGILFLIAELVSVSFVFVFLGIGALLTALISWLGLTPDLGSQLLGFSIVTVATLAVLRRPLRHWFRNRKHAAEYTEYVGDKALVTDAIPPDGEGRIFYRGTEWIAVSDRKIGIAKGVQVVIRRMDGIRAVVE